MTRFLGSIGVLAAVAFVACAESAGNEAPPSGDPDASSLPPGHTDGEDAGLDADAGDVVVTPRVCSDHGFCHTPVPGDAKLEAVWGDGAGAVWAVSAGGGVLRWNGNAWKVHASGLGALRAIWGSGPTDIWVAGEGGVHHGTGASSAAVTFVPSELPGGAAVDVSSLWGTGANDVWIVGMTVAESRVLHWDGSWSIVSVPPGPSALSRVWGSAGAGVWLAGTRPLPDELFEEIVIYRRAPGAASFSEIALPTDPDDTSVFSKVGSLQGAAATSDTSMWILGRTLSSVPGLWRGASVDGGQTFTFTYARDGRHDDPEWTGVFGTGPNDAWSVGQYGRVRRWDGAEWRAASITLTKYPLTDPLSGAWSKDASEAWFVGDGIALRYDPTKKDGGK